MGEGLVSDTTRAWYCEPESEFKYLEVVDPVRELIDGV